MLRTWWLCDDSPWSNKLIRAPARGYSMATDSSQFSYCHLCCWQLFQSKGVSIKFSCYFKARPFPTLLYNGQSQTEIENQTMRSQTCCTYWISCFNHQYILDLINYIDQLERYTQLYSSLRNGWIKRCIK